MKDLIERLEQSRAGSRELDDAIATAIWGEPKPSGNAGEVKTLVWWHNGVGRSMSPRFTESLDDAMTLIPPGLWDGHIIWNGGERDRGGYVELNCGPVSDTGKWRALVNSYEDQDDRNEVPKPRPLPIAICIAALRARAAEETP